jgi:hypothetical protein
MASLHAPGHERRWRHFNRMLLGSAALVSCVLYAFIVLVDPHDHLALSLPLERVPINQNQRFSYPALARSDAFDAVVIGTSTARLVRPQNLDRSLAARFANLSMNSATAYEQARLLEVFLRHHPQPRFVLLGLDVPWCSLEADTERYTFREFPQWLYDTDPFNDYLHLFNGKALEQAVRMVQFWAGLREPRYGRDGYRNFLPDASQYDLARARELIYGPAGVRERHRPSSPATVPLAERAAWRIPGTELLRDLLARIPAHTGVLLFFVPYHVFHQPLPGTLAHAHWQECRARVVAAARARPGTRVIDFMIESPLTLRDEHYWDPLHFNTSVADSVDAALAGALRDVSLRHPAFTWLHPK